MQCLHVLGLQICQVNKTLRLHQGSLYIANPRQEDTVLAQGAKSWYSHAGHCETNGKDAHVEELQHKSMHSLA